MSFLTHKGLLHSIFTQNIDALELKAKIPQDKIVFAHGNSNEAHCSVCRQEIDIDLINKHIYEGKILYCSDEKCKAPCKPKIVFYGEQLPSDFFKKAYSIQESDLAFIMGSSLKVSPFNMLPDLLGTDTWRVVINREKVGREGVSGFKYDDVLSWDLFIPGTTDEIIKQLIEDCAWSDEFNSFVESKINE
jgi:NAD-dependent histone deacetylase SIR2